MSAAVNRRPVPAMCRQQNLRLRLAVNYLYVKVFAFFLKDEYFLSHNSLDHILTRLQDGQGIGVRFRGGGAGVGLSPLGTGALFPEAKLPGHEADRSDPSDADVKIAWNYSSTFFTSSWRDP